MTTDQLNAFYAACRATLQHCPDQYAKSYANAGLGLSDSDSVRVQCLYVLNNIQYWRGDVARQCRETFKKLSKEIKS